jgi:hypothetical protein
MAGWREKMQQIHDFPGFKRMYIAAFDEMLKARERRGLKNKQGWETGKNVFDWWIEKEKHTMKGQMEFNFDD